MPQTKVKMYIGTVLISSLTANCTTSSVNSIINIMFTIPETYRTDAQTQIFMLTYFDI